MFIFVGGFCFLVWNERMDDLDVLYLNCYLDVYVEVVLSIDCRVFGDNVMQVMLFVRVGEW